MPRLTKETYGSGNQSWLANGHGIGEAITVPLVTASFKDIAKDGYIPSGTPVDLAAKGPYKSGTDGQQLGFVLFDTKVTATDAATNAPVIVHGIIKKANVPGGDALPASAGNFTFVGGK